MLGQLKICLIMARGNKRSLLSHWTNFILAANHFDVLDSGQRYLYFLVGGQPVKKPQGVSWKVTQWTGNYSSVLECMSKTQYRLEYLFEKSCSSCLTPRRLSVPKKPTTDVPRRWWRESMLSPLSAVNKPQSDWSRNIGSHISSRADQHKPNIFQHLCLASATRCSQQSLRPLYKNANQIFGCSFSKTSLINLRTS
jgi:hypothetical protein